MNQFMFFLLIQRMIMTESILNSLPGCLYWKDKEGRYLGRNMASKESMKKYGFSEEDINGLTDFDLFSHEQAQQFKEHDELTLQTKQEQVLEEVIISPDGSINVHYSIKRPLYFQEKMVGVVGNSINITHLKKIEQELLSLKEQAKSSEKAKSIFFKNIEHDLKTPNSIIELATQELLNDETDKHRIKMLNNIRFYSQQMSEHINQLIEFSRLGEMSHLKSQVMNCHQLLNNIYNASQLKNNNKDVRLILTMDSTIPKMIVSNSYALTRILTNMMDNALKFTHQGEINLRVRLSKGDVPMPLQIEVSDTGFGIDEEAIDHVFDIFYRKHVSADTEFLGKGLGLSIVKQLVELLGGDISVESQVGVGTTFLISLPHDKVEGSVSNDEGQQTDVTLGSKDALSVLLVEDHPLCAQMAARLLSKAGYRVDVVMNGQEALSKLLSTSYDVVLTDLNLPDMDGFDLAESIRLASESACAPMIVALSANTPASYSNKINAHSIDAFLSKPLSIEDLNSYILSKKRV